MKRLEKYNKISSRLLIVISIIFITVSASAAQTATQKLQQSVAKYLKSGVNATFTFSGSGGNGKGSLKSSGKKFVLESGTGSIWYNGVNMWTYSPSTKETTLTKPTAAEIAESNPLSILAGATTGFSASYAAKQATGTSTIILTPQSKRSGIKRVVVVLNETNLKPQKIEVTTSDGSKSTLNITTISSGQKHPGNIFVYPKSRYKNVKIVDLR